ncbi:hypothetical protein, partial [Streptococcus pneumoniae]|uniref:hypothetical protein n=1 Tax=Streptococcus pneumoniae TaxID=1313 RepID=UPI001C7184E2
RSEHQKRKDEICPFSSLAFLQPTTVDKEPKKRILSSVKNLLICVLLWKCWVHFLLKLIFS